MYTDDVIDVDIDIDIDIDVGIDVDVHIHTHTHIHILIPNLLCPSPLPTPRFLAQVTTRWSSLRLVSGEATAPPPTL